MNLSCAMFSASQECHKKAWDLVGDYMQENLMLFEGRSHEAEGTVLPKLTSRVSDTLTQIPASWNQLVSDWLV